LVKPLSGGVGASQVGVRIPIGGVERDRPLKVWNRFVRTALLTQGHPQVVVEVRCFRTGGEGFLQMRNGLVELALGQQRGPKVGLRPSVAGLNSSAFRKCTMASSNLPCRASAAPRLLWASVYAASISMAFR